MRVPAYPHRKAVHCGAGTLASALAHRGLWLSEPMVFGLGAGLGFALHEGEPPQQASRFFVGRSPSFEQDLCASLRAVGAISRARNGTGASSMAVTESELVGIVCSLAIEKMQTQCQRSCVSLSGF